MIKVVFVYVCMVCWCVGVCSDYGGVWVVVLCVVIMVVFVCSTVCSNYGGVCV